jgi:hypothetical protein
MTIYDFSPTMLDKILFALLNKGQGRKQIATSFLLVRSVTSVTSVPLSDILRAIREYDKDLVYLYNNDLYGFSSGPFCKEFLEEKGGFTKLFYDKAQVVNRLAILNKMQYKANIATVKSACFAKELVWISVLSCILTVLTPLFHFFL